MNGPHSGRTGDRAPPPPLLYAVVFLCGAVLMGLEVVGSRVLAPYFGNSIFVWGSLISVVLAALSAGYWVGGRLADRWPRMPVLSLLIALPGVVVALMPFYYPSLNDRILSSGLGARMGPLVSSVVLFLAPGALLGTVSPFAVRLRASAVSSVGGAAGGLYAVSTGGSIAGTAATAYLLPGIVGVETVVHLLGVALLLVSALALFGGRRAALGGAALAGAALLAAFALHYQGSRPARDGVVLKKDTFYHRIQVQDYGRYRSLRFDATEQSTMALDDPARLELLYTKTMALALVFRPEPKAVLALGLGGGSLPKRILLDYPDLVLDAVEIDPEVVSIARRYFGLPEDLRLRVHTMDGRRFVRETDMLYDLVFLDAYNADTIPFHLATREFYREIEARLAPGGMVCSNIIGTISGEGNAYFQAMYRTIAETFPVVYVFPVIEWASSTVSDELNVIVIAGRDGVRLTREEIRARAALLKGKLVPADELAEIASALYENAENPKDFPLLTDDYAPVDNLIAEGM